MKRRQWVVLGIVVLVAWGLRAAYIVETRDGRAAKALPGLDVDLSEKAAAQLRNGYDGLPRFALSLPTAPGYPLLLAAAQSVLGEERSARRSAHRWLHACFGGILAALLFATVWRVTRSGWAAALGAGCYAIMPSTIHFDTVPIKASFVLVLVGLVLFALAGALRRQAWTGRGAAIASLVIAGCFAALVAIQLNTFLYAPSLIAAIVLSRRMPWRAVGRFFAPTAVLLALTMSWLALGPSCAPDADTLYIPNSGVHIRIGHNPRAAPVYRPLRGLGGMPVDHAFGSRLLASIEAGSALSAAEADRHHRARAVGFVLEHPGRSVALAWQKIRFFFNDFEPKGNHFLPVLQTESRVLRAVDTVWGLGPLWIAGLIATFLAWRRHRGIVLVCWAIVVAVLAANLLTFVTWRYRLAVVAPLAVLVGVGLGSLTRSHLQEARRLCRAGPPVRVAVAALVVAAWSYVVMDDVGAPVRGMFVEHERGNAAEVARVPELRAAAQRLRRAHEPGSRARRIEILGRLHEHRAAFGEIAALPSALRAQPRVAAWELRYLAWLDRREEARARLGELDAAGQISVTWHLLTPVERGWLRLVTELPLPPPSREELALSRPLSVVEDVWENGIPRP